MADMELAEAGNVSQDNAPTIGESPQEVKASPKALEKTFTQAELDKIAARIRDETRNEYYNRGKQDAMNQSIPSQSKQSMGGMEQVSPEKIESMIEDKIKEQANLEFGRKIAQDFTSKLMAAKDKYPDFEETVAQLNLPTIPHLVSWANSLDNTADVMYDIAKNPGKFANILMLSQTSPQLAQRELSKLSDSIKKNQEGVEAGAASIKEPLSQLRPSSVGTDNGSLTVRDLRKQPWLRA